MNLQALVDAFSCDDLDAQVRSVARDEAGDLLVEIEYAELIMLEEKRLVRLRCIQPREVNLTAGYIGSIAHFEDHALLTKHQGPQAQLFFSSAPSSPAEVFYLAHSVLTSELQGWRDPSEYLNGTPVEISKHLSGGYGLLARGPSAAMVALAKAVQSLLRVNVIESVTLQGAFIALVLDHQYVICTSVDVLPMPAQDSQ